MYSGPPFKFCVSLGSSRFYRWFVYVLQAPTSCCNAIGASIKRSQPFLAPTPSPNNQVWFLPLPKLNRSLIRPLGVDPCRKVQSVSRDVNRLLRYGYPPWSGQVSAGFLVYYALSDGALIPAVSVFGGASQASVSCDDERPEVLHIARAVPFAVLQLWFCLFMCQHPRYGFGFWAFCGLCTFFYLPTALHKSLHTEQLLKFQSAFLVYPFAVFGP